MIYTSDSVFDFESANILAIGITSLVSFMGNTPLARLGGFGCFAVLLLRGFTWPHDAGLGLAVFVGAWAVYVAKIVAGFLFHVGSYWSILWHQSEAFVSVI